MNSAMHQPALLCLLALLAAACSGPAPTDPKAVSTAALVSDEEPEARTAARAGLRRFLDLVPERGRAEYGFSSQDELSRAQLAEPYRVWTADSSQLEAGAGAEALGATREWRFPVTVDGEPRALLTVAAMDGRLQAVDLGAAHLARELGQLERARAVAPRSRRILLRIHRIRADLVAFPEADAKIESTRFEPLASAQALPQAPRGPVEVPRLLPWLRDRVLAARHE